MELLWRLFERFGEHRPIRDNDGLLALLSREKRTFRANNIAEIQKLKGFERGLRKFVALEDKLKLIRAIIDGAEVHLTHAANRHQPPRDTHSLAFFKCRAYLREILMVILAPIRRIAQFFQCLHILQALLTIFVYFRHFRFRP